MEPVQIKQEMEDCYSMPAIEAEECESDDEEMSANNFEMEGATTSSSNDVGEMRGMVVSNEGLPSLDKFSYEFSSSTVSGTAYIETPSNNDRGYGIYETLQKDARVGRSRRKQDFSRPTAGFSSVSQILADAVRRNSDSSLKILSHSVPTFAGRSFQNDAASSSQETERKSIDAFPRASNPALFKTRASRVSILTKSGRVAITARPGEALRKATIENNRSSESPHVVANTRENFLCPLCPAQFEQKSELSEHVRRCHGDEIATLGSILLPEMMAKNDVPDPVAQSPVPTAIQPNEHGVRVTTPVASPTGENTKPKETQKKGTQNQLPKATRSSAIECVLPDTFEYEIESSSVDQQNFKAIVRVKCKNEEELMQWKRDLEKKTKTVWIVCQTKPHITKSKYGNNYVCQRSWHNKKTNSEQECCKAKMSLTIKRDTRDVRKKDRFVKRGFLSVVKLSWLHNHRLPSDVIPAEDGQQEHQDDQQHRPDRNKADACVQTIITGFSMAGYEMAVDERLNENQLIYLPLDLPSEVRLDAGAKSNNHLAQGRIASSTNNIRRTTSTDQLDESDEDSDSSAIEQPSAEFDCCHVCECSKLDLSQHVNKFHQDWVPCLFSLCTAWFVSSAARARHLLTAHPRAVVKRLPAAALSPAEALPSDEATTSRDAAPILMKPTVDQPQRNHDGEQSCLQRKKLKRTTSDDDESWKPRKRRAKKAAQKRECELSDVSERHDDGDSGASLSQSVEGNERTRKQQEEFDPLPGLAWTEPVGVNSTCNICRLTMGSGAGLASHMQKMHGSELVSRCPLCQNWYRNSTKTKTMHAHMKNEHGVEPDPW